MSKSQQPKRPRQLKSKRINTSDREKWNQILKDITKDEIPVTVLKSVVVNLKDGTEVEIDVLELLEEGLDPEEIEFQLNSRLKKMDDIIRDVDFFIDIDSVKNAVQPMTDKILKDL